MPVAEMPAPLLALLPMLGAALLAYLMSANQQLLGRALPVRQGALPCLVCAAAGFYACGMAYGPVAGTLAAAVTFMLAAVMLPYLLSLRRR